jgi:hypothetical protein
LLAGGRVMRRLGEVGEYATTTQGPCGVRLSTCLNQSPGKARELTAFRGPTPRSPRATWAPHQPSSDCDAHITPSPCHPWQRTWDSLAAPPALSRSTYPPRTHRAGRADSSRAVRWEVGSRMTSSGTPLPRRRASRWRRARGRHSVVWTPGAGHQSNQSARGTRQRKGGRGGRCRCRPTHARVKIIVTPGHTGGIPVCAKRREPIALAR